MNNNYNNNNNQELIINNHITKDNHKNQNPVYHNN